MNPARFRVVEDTPTHLLLLDLGPWEHNLTITNDVERVVAFLRDLKGRRLYYIDSLGELTEILVAEGKFAGFVPAREL